MGRQKGFKLSERHKEIISRANKGKLLSRMTRQKISMKMKGKCLSEEHRGKISKALKGKPHSEECKRKLSEVMKGKNKGNPSPNKGKYGSKATNWRGGISYFPYPPIFNKELKLFIKNRDSDECQNPFCNHLSKKLNIHHIDFDKNNCSQFNLITLCNSCNLKANRIYRWQRLYRRIVWSKYE